MFICRLNKKEEVEETLSSVTTNLNGAGRPKCTVIDRIGNLDKKTTAS